jgi:hypothetical protein
MFQHIDINYDQYDISRKGKSHVNHYMTQPRRRKPAFVTHDNEASLCVTLESDVNGTERN